jgi:hypothetical protein
VVAKVIKSSISILVLTVAVALVPSSSYAQTAPVTPATPITEASCMAAKTKVTTHKAAILATQTERLPMQTTVKNRIDAFIVSATDAKYTGVGSITTAQDSLSQALGTYGTQTTTYVSALDAVVAASCADGAGAYQTALTTARTELTKLRTDSLSVKTVLTKSSTPALRDYATWLKNSGTTVEETN